MVSLEFSATQEIVVESIAWNTMAARMEVNDRAEFKARGNSVDTCLLEFLQDNDIEVEKEVKILETNLLAAVPFIPYKMRSITVLQHPADPNLVRVYVKGAPEVVLTSCSQKHDSEGEIVPFSGEEQQKLMEEVITEQFAKRCFRTIVCAYKDLSKEEYNDLAKWH